MIITRTPFRISFVGGTTDFKYFYKNQPGMVVSSAIDKYIYVIVNKRFEGNIRLSYSQTETVDSLDQVQHKLIREAMRKAGVVSGVNISTIADIPGKGSGLGSSSSFTIGVLNALYVLKGIYKPAEELAKEACQIEIDTLGAPIGKQDQYIAAYGGLKAITFRENEEVDVEEIPIADEKKKELDSNLLLFHIGKPRESHAILSRQVANAQSKMESLIKIRDFAKEARECLINNQIDQLGSLLHKNWLEKKQLAQGITDPEIDQYYQKALSAGALGGKLCGAGGSGFLLIYCKKENQDKVRQVLSNLKETSFKLEPEGSKIIYKD